MEETVGGLMQRVRDCMFSTSIIFAFTFGWNWRWRERWDEEMDMD